MKTVHGWSFPDADTFMAKEMQPDGSYQADHLVTAMRFVTDRRCAIDGGAHVGQFSRPMAALFERVIAVEPAPDTFDCLVANMNRFGLLNVTPERVALRDRSDVVALTLDAKQVKRGNTGGRYVVEGGSVQCASIDSWDLSDLGFLKLDVEGSEPYALAGAAKTLVRCKPIVLFEDKQFWTRDGLAKDEPQRILRQLGYEHKDRVGHDEIWGPA